MLTDYYVIIVKKSPKEMASNVLNGKKFNNETNRRFLCVI